MIHIFLPCSSFRSLLLHLHAYGNLNFSFKSFIIYL
jgi:hypothetical protein